MDFSTIFERRRRFGVIAIAMLVLAGQGFFAAPLRAGDLQAFNQSVAEAYRSFRGASFYLRTGNLAVAALELEDFRAAWRAIETRYRDAPPDAFADDPKWRETLRDVGTRADKALDAADDDDIKQSASIIAPIRGLLAALRARSGVTVFSDCVNEANAAGQALLSMRAKSYPFEDEAWLNRLRARAAVVSYVYAKCGRTAPPAIRDAAGFKRMIDGALDEMNSILEAIVQKNDRLLSITLGEFRSYDRILFLEFG